MKYQVLEKAVELLESTGHEDLVNQLKIADKYSIKNIYLEVIIVDDKEVSDYVKFSIDMDMDFDDEDEIPYNSVTYTSLIEGIDCDLESFKNALSELETSVLTIEDSSITIEEFKSTSLYSETNDFEEISRDEEMPF